MTDLVFVSSSGDLATLRQRVSDALDEWLRENGFDHLMAPYLWEKDSEGAKLLSDRVSIQEQLPDPASGKVPLTICLFGERCGQPLQDELPAHWNDRLARWKAETDDPGILHPWPDKIEAQSNALDRGAFPLTGTVFEFFAAHDQDPDADNLVVAYTASRFVADSTNLGDIDFNDRRLWLRLSAGTTSDGEREQINRHVYAPQKAALLNFLKFVSRRITPPPWYSSLEELEQEVLARAKGKLRRRLGIVSLRNPFKSTLEHWTIDDRRDLPGRGKLIREICQEVRRHSDTLFLLKGRSGCGKSSLLQRGVLAELRDKGALTVAFRPTDLDETADNRDRLDILWDIIADEVGCHDRDVSDPSVKRGREKRMADHLCKVLCQRNVTVVLGLDQFEEILDELNLTKDARSRARGWWLVLKFFSQLAASPHVMLVATLESSREQTFLDLKIEREIRLQRNILDVDVNATDVAEIAKQGFARGGLPLAADVVEAIKRKWVEFESETASQSKSASPLPLACLWFAGLYERFEDLASASPADRLDIAAIRAFDGDSRILSLADIGKEGIAFENVIQKLADEAWQAAGKSTHFRSNIEEDDKYGALMNFLGPLVGLDKDGHKRLLSVPELGGDPPTTSLRHEFKTRRLLVPVPSRNQRDDGTSRPRVRLVHQCVIDQWSPAIRWFDKQKDYLFLEDRFRQEATYWSGRGQPIPVDDETVIANAAEVLAANHIDWTISEFHSLSSEDQLLRDQAISVFLNSRTPDAVVRSVRRRTHAHVAAAYHLVELLERFKDISPECLQLTCKEGRNLLEAATWSKGPAVDFLLAHNVPLRTPKYEWSAIAAPIVLKLRRNYDSLIQKIDNIDEEIGPHKWRMVHIAAWSCNLEVLFDLKARKACVYAEDAYQRTALHWVAAADHPSTFLFLLDLVSPNAADQFGDNPIGFAASRGSANTVRAFLNSDTDDDTVASVLAHKNKNGQTPLMLAAKYKQPNVLQLLLNECDPRDGVHRTEDGKTLLHLAVESGKWDKPSDDEKVRARRVVSILLEDDGRLDPTLKDDEGNTAFDVAQAYEDARRVIRRDKRMPRDYEKMTPKMRIDDLSSRKPTVVLDLLRNAPQALTDRHERDETGLDILVRTKNIQALSLAVKEGIIADDVLGENLERLVKLACAKSAGPLREAIIGRLRGNDADRAFLPLLLNASVRDKDSKSILVLRQKGAKHILGDEALGTTVFHSLAVTGKLEEFEEKATGIALPLPLDKWGRRPSDLAAPEQQRRFRELEEKIFADPCHEHPVAASPTKFHEYARKGDVRNFEIQARGAGSVLPRDADGRCPSEVAPDEHKDEIAAVEARCFTRAN